VKSTEVFVFLAQAENRDVQVYRVDMLYHINIRKGDLGNPEDGGIW
jgi:hypothetical protein